MSADAVSWPVKVVARSGWPWLACAVWYAALIGLRLLPGMAQHNGIFVVVATLSAVLASGAMLVLGQGRAATLVVHSDRIALGEHALDRASLSHELLIWKEGYLWTTVGSAIRLRDAKHALCIGGRNHLATSRDRRSSVSSVDASLSADDFVAFLRAVGLNADESKPASDTDSIAIDLVASTVTAGGTWRVMAPWLATMVAAAMVGIGGSALGLERSPTGLLVMQVLTVVVVVGGLIKTIRKSSRPPVTRYRLLVERGVVTLDDAKRRGRTHSSEQPLSATRHIYHYSARGGSYDMPTVRLVWPSGLAQVIGLWDTSYHWPSGATRLRKLEYIVGPEEWRRLLAALRLT